jgi:GT2 family glycosyltransferase/SAM-dependent methyltransferase
VPTYNQAGFLPETLESLLAQTRTDWEAVVVNDGSTDGTREVLESFAARDPRIRALHKENGGVATALNEALARARGEWICWLSSDDLFEPDALETWARAAEARPEVKFFHGDFYELVQESGTRRTPPGNRAPSIPAPATQLVTLLRGNYVHGISIAVHRSVFEQVGRFDPALRYGQDVDMWLRIHARFRSAYVDRRTCTTRIHAAAGTAGFPQAGPFDVARSALAFLNAHPFADLFPALDLERPDDVVTAIQATLTIAGARDAYMYQGVGPVPALLDRLQEWWSNACPARYRPALRDSFRRVAGAVSDLGLPPPLEAAIRRLAEPAGAGFRYVPVDPVEAMLANLAALEARGDGGAVPLRRYLAMIGATPAVAAAPAVVAPGRRPGGRYVNVGMITYNRLDFTRRAIDAILARTDHPFVLTVVDNGSTDGTRELLTGLADRGVVQNLVLLDENVGVARASNLAWSLEPEAAWYLKLDNDVVVQRPGWLGALVRAVEEVPELGAVAYNVEPVSYPVSEVRGHRLRLKRDGNLGGACILVPRRTHLALGYWAEHYGPYGEEDADYCFRIRKSGGLIAYLEDEDACFHLPAGKAAVIDPATLAARDGAEELQDAEYRAWKDARRRENVRSGAFDASLRAYAAGTRPLKVGSPFVEARRAGPGRPTAPAAPRATGAFPESRLAHELLDGLSGLEIGASTHNPFGLRTRNVGIWDEIYDAEQRRLTGEAAPIHVSAAADAVPLPSESEDFVLSSHVLEHCPDLVRTLVEWYRLVRPGGLLYMIVPHRDAAPSDVGRPLTTWEHVVEDYARHVTPEMEPAAGRFLHCHYHVFTRDSLAGIVSLVFGARVELVAAQDRDDKIGNGFTLVYRKVVPLAQAYPWTVEVPGLRLGVPRPADFHERAGTTSSAGAPRDERPVDPRRLAV